MPRSPIPSSWPCRDCAEGIGFTVQSRNTDPFDTPTDVQPRSIELRKYADSKSTAAGPSVYTARGAVICGNRFGDAPGLRKEKNIPADGCRAFSGYLRARPSDFLRNFRVRGSKLSLGKRVFGK